MPACSISFNMGIQFFTSIESARLNVTNQKEKEKEHYVEKQNNTKLKKLPWDVTFVFPRYIQDALKHFNIFVLFVMNFSSVIMNDLHHRKVE